MASATLAGCLLLGSVPIRAASVRFAVIADYGVDNANQLAVANLVKTNLQPEFIVTLGDNTYGGPDDLDRYIGKYYHEFIGNYSGEYGIGASSNRFFPAIGNHDYFSSGGYEPYLEYFTLPGNERYYDVRRGPVHLFILNSDTNEPDATTPNSVQGQWLSNQLASSTAPWKLVAFHHAPHSSTYPASRMRWPFREWGADAVLAGHAHNYERILLDDFPYLVNGLGGASIMDFDTPVPGSVVRYNEAHGAMQVIATEWEITFEFHSVADGGSVIDRFTIERLTVVPILTISPGLRENEIVLSWRVMDSEVELQTSPALNAAQWQRVATPILTENGTNSVTIPATKETMFFRLESLNAWRWLATPPEQAE
jgi:tartrate-resistant acid phosphatase type 5